MRKIEVQKAKQKTNEFFSLIADPRTIIKLVDIPKADQHQETQRPWKDKRVKEISKYVAGKQKINEDIESKKYARGLIPNSPIINIKNDKILIKEDAGRFFIYLPENEQEFINCCGSIEILDGQHRLIAFSDEFIDSDFKDSIKYEMHFVIFKTLAQEEKRELFMICNDKQEKVESNILRQFKKWLGLLSEDDDLLYEIIEKLNKEDMSPLKNRIAIGGNKVKGGLKLTQLSTIIKKSKVWEIIKDYDDAQKLRIISLYLKAWDKAYSGYFNNPRHALGKISGTRLILNLFPHIFEITKEKKEFFSEQSISSCLEKIKLRWNLIDYNKDELLKVAFRGETSTIEAANIIGRELRNEILKDSEIFDPFKAI